MVYVPYRLGAVYETGTDNLVLFASKDDRENNFPHDVSLWYLELVEHRGNMTQINVRAPLADRSFSLTYIT